MKSNVLTSTATVNFTTGPTTNTVKIWMVGGGGGGGGCTNAAGTGCAGGGGSGGVLEVTVAVSPNTAYSYRAGAGGAGNSGAGGGNGIDSFITIGATTYTAKGGTGGPVAVPAAAAAVFVGGAGGTVSTNGDLNGAGNPGQGSNNAGGLLSGNGGASTFGGAGLGRITDGNGAAAIGFGSGGAGAAANTTTARAGGAGSQGVLLVDEYTLFSFANALLHLARRMSDHPLRDLFPKIHERRRVLLERPALLGDGLASA